MSEIIAGIASELQAAGYKLDDNVEIVGKKKSFFGRIKKRIFERNEEKDINNFYKKYGFSSIIFKTSNLEALTFKSYSPEDRKWELAILGRPGVAYLDGKATKVLEVCL
jgi:hypothetical protein